MRRIFLLSIAILMSFLTAGAHRMSLRIMSQTPVSGTEEARSLMFDRYGMMWVGTDQGVRTFDGYRFKTYRNDAYSPGILPNNYVLQITEAPDDQLWFGTYDGLACFDRVEAVIDHLIKKCLFIGEADINRLFAHGKTCGKLVHREFKAPLVENRDRSVQNAVPDDIFVFCVPWHNGFLLFENGG